MFRFFIMLDDGLIERVFQPLCDLITDQCGLSRTRAAALCLDLAALSWVLSQTPDLSAAALDWQFVPACFHLAMLMLGLIALLALQALFRRVGARPGNPLRLAMRPHRAVLILLLVARLGGLTSIDVADIADLAMLSLATLALYLGACAARPPTRRGFALPQPA